MPAYNEESYLAVSVTAVRAGLLAAGEPFEILVVENGSTDRTASVLDELASSFPEVRGLRLPTADYGEALRQGVLAAAGEYVAIFDVDYYDLEFLAAARVTFATADPPAAVVGSKRGPGAVDARPRHRRLITAVFAWVLRVLFGAGLPDTHGVKVLDRAAFAPLVARCGQAPDLFDSELILRAQRAGLRIDYVPVEVRELRPPRSSVLRRVPRTLVGLARLRWRLWREPAAAAAAPSQVRPREDA